MPVLAMTRKSFAAPVPPTLTTAVIRAASRLGLSEKELSDALGISAPTWSKQKTGAEGHRMHVQRFDDLPTDYHGLFLDALIDELARMRGRVVVQPAGQMAAFVRAMRAMTDACEQMVMNGQPALPFERSA